MSPVEALEAARTAGIQISVDGDDLVLESAAEPPVAVVDLLTEHKAGILAILRSGQAAGAAEERVAIAEFEVRADSHRRGAPPRLHRHHGRRLHGHHRLGLHRHHLLLLRRHQRVALRRHHRLLRHTALLRPAQPWVSEDWLAFYDEKVGIAEYDHGLSRQEAEKRAMSTASASG